MREYKRLFFFIRIFIIECLHKACFWTQVQLAVPQLITYVSSWRYQLFLHIIVIFSFSLVSPSDLSCIFFHFFWLLSFLLTSIISFFFFNFFWGLFTVFFIALFLVYKCVSVVKKKKLFRKSIYICSCINVQKNAYFRCIVKQGQGQHNA